MTQENLKQRYFPKELPGFTSTFNSSEITFYSTFLVEKVIKLEDIQR